jgi:replicative DNA helicase
MVHGFALSNADALDLIWREYNPRCEPPWTRREIEHKIESARSFTSGPLTERVPDREREYIPPERFEDWIPEPPPWLSDEKEEEAEDATADDPAETAERQAIENEPARKRPAFTIMSMRDLLKPVMDQMFTAGPHNTVGVPTGSGELDEAIGGLRRGNITVLGGRRSFGKTSCTIMTVDEAFDAANVWGRRHKLLLFAGEDAATMYGKRFMARRADVNALQLRDMNQRFTQVQTDRAVQAVGDAPQDLFFVPAHGMPVEQIADVIEYVCDTEDIALVIVDYIQCLKALKHANDRRLQVTHIFQTLGHTIKRCNAAGLILSQVKRTQNLTQWPTVEALKESGDVEDGAEHILLGHKTEAGRLIRVAKNKDGTDPDDLPDIEMPFHKHTASFVRNYPEKPQDHWNDVDNDGLD